MEREPKIRQMSAYSAELESKQLMNKARLGSVLRMPGGFQASSSHPLHYPGDPYYVNSVASEMSVVRPTSQVCAGCCSAPRTRGVGGTGVTPIIVDIYLDGVAGGSGRPFSAGLILFLEAGTTFSGYLQQQIGDNQWDKKVL